MPKPIRQHWLIKSEPSVYSYAQLEKDKRTAWTGIRNFEARNNLRAMSVGDLALYYHTGDEKQVVGVARVVSKSSEDPTAPGEDWASVDVEAVRRLASPVTLGTVKKNPKLKGFPLVARGRLSVAPVSAEAFELIVALSKTARKGF
jgi:predicted RNA-binding protein with PUA-like domain